MTGASPLGEQVAIPWLRCPARPSVVCAAVVLLDRRGPAPAEPVLTVHALDAGGHTIDLSWPDGVTATVLLPAPEWTVGPSST